jgi:hypothetical protein
MSPGLNTCDDEAAGCDPISGTIREEIARSPMSGLKAGEKPFRSYAVVLLILGSRDLFFCSGRPERFGPD